MYIFNKIKFNFKNNDEKDKLKYEFNVYALFFKG